MLIRKAAQMKYLNAIDSNSLYIAPKLGEVAFEIVDSGPKGSSNKGNGTVLQNGQSCESPVSTFVETRAHASLGIDLWPSFASPASLARF